MNTSVSIVASRSLFAIALAVLAACGGGSGGGSGGATYTIGGTVSGLRGSGLVLLDNGGNSLAVSASGPFAFSAPVANGAAYLVTVSAQPSSPAQTCVVTGGSGTVGTANVTSVAVECANAIVRRYFAYAANADDNTISAYLIDPITGALAAIGAPVAAGLSPRAIAVSPDKQHVYVANELSNDISAYAVNAATGELTPIAGSPFAAGINPQALAFGHTTSQNQYLYAANKGSNDLSAYSVNPGDGVLTPLVPATYATGTGPSAVLADSWNSLIFVANGGGSNDVSVFRIAAGTGALAPVVGSPFAAGGSPHSLAVANFTDWLTFSFEYVYTANSNGSGSTISGFAVDQSTGSLIALSGSPFPLAVSNNITVTNFGHLYVTTGANVEGYSIDENTGLLTALSSFPIAAGANAYSMADGPINGYFYVGNDGAASISGYQSNDLGKLIPVPGSPFSAGNRPDSLATL
jgi:6-phosphogluconolactonase